MHVRRSSADRGRQRVPRVQEGLRHHAGHGLRARSRPPRGDPRRIWYPSSPRPRSGARTSSSCATSAARPWCSCRTSRASWWAGDAEAGGIAKNGAKMVTAAASTRVPKFTVVVGGSAPALLHVRARTPRGSCSCGPTPGSSVMGGPQAVSVLSTVKKDQWRAASRWDPQEQERFRLPSVNSSSPRATRTTPRPWPRDDGAIEPAVQPAVPGHGAGRGVLQALPDPGLRPFRM
ncbi:carboxyl transferase domain-containing protein [Kocuria rhizophila]|nr:carboxyl transferase domain-containing protein [Kocuria rhizophila]